MNERGAAAVNASTGSAGALLREARVAQGVHIAALAASIKVAPRKLEALENDRLDELIDAAFARALAKTVCRVLKIDAEPVLARLPQPPAQRLEHATRGLDQPFRDGGVVHVSRDGSALLRPVVWGPLLIVLAALGLLLLPPNLLRDFTRSVSGPDPAASGVSVEVFPAQAASAPAQSGVATMPEPAPAAALPAAQAAVDAPGAAASAVAVSPSGAAAVPPAGDAPIVITARASSWVEVVDSASVSLISRTVAAGETVRLNGTPPFRLKVGNAAGTELLFRGQPIDLPATTRNNVARLELK